MIARIVMHMTQEGGWDREDEAWARRVLRELVPKIEEAQCNVSLVPDGPPDVKFAVELGLSVMMDKPIVLVVRPGVRVPAKLLALADVVLAGDISSREEAEALERRLGEYLVRRFGP